AKQSSGHPASFRPVSLLGENPPDLRPQADRVAIRAHFPDHARPDLMPLTRGYRRTPVMQIGADVYCDTQCIMRELERRFPEASLFALEKSRCGGASSLQRRRPSPLQDTTMWRAISSYTSRAPASWSRRLRCD